jgi:phosphatidylglycerophosphate synthase
MSNISIKDIKQRYLASKEKEKRFTWTYYVRRPASYYLAWPFIRLGVSATTVTIIWLFVAVIGCAIIASGGHLNLIVGTALLELAVILDCVDGHIARFTRPTRTGDVLDTWVGEILLVAAIFSIGIGLSSSPGLVANTILPFALEGSAFMQLGFFGALASLASWTVRLHWRTIAQKAGIDDKEVEIQNSKRTKIIDNLFHYSGALTMLMVVAAILYILDVMLFVISAVYTIYLLMMMARILRRVRALDSQNREQ